MAYEVTATKKRPRNFDQIADQEFVVTTLKNSLTQGRIAHAYLFSGPRGVGKTSAARVLAKALNCQTGPTAEPCGECDTCQAITAGNSMDVFEIDGASNTSVNDIREIKDEVLFAPTNSRYKIYIIDEVHMLSNSAFNALLKTIEEPPPYIVFIFATTEIHKVPATIRSRCQQFNFRLFSLQGIKNCLENVVKENNLNYEDDALLWIAKEATGSLRDAYTLLDQVISFSKEKISLEEIRKKLGIIGLDELNEVFSFIYQEDTKSLLEQLDLILSKGISIEQFVIDLVEYLRNILFIKQGITKDYILGYNAEHYPKDIINNFTPSQIEQALELTMNLYKNLKFSLNQRFELELLMSRLTSIKNHISKEDLVSELKRIKKSLLSIPAQSSTEDDSEVEPSKTSDINVLEELIKELHNAKKQKLAAALEKISSYKNEGEIFTLIFPEKLKFYGEVIKKEIQTIREIIQRYVPAIKQIQVDFSAVHENENTEQEYDRAKVLKDIFQGEEIQKEDN